VSRDSFLLRVRGTYKMLSVRKPAARERDQMYRVSMITLGLIAVALAACRAAPPLPRTELLEKLHQCHDTMTKERSENSPPSPCAKLDPSSLNGISRSELAAALGPPTLCLGLSEGGAPSGPDCPAQLNPKWSFHRIGGDGLELFCETDENQHCEVVRWIQSEY
jgi:hypothetical protein